MAKFSLDSRVGVSLMKALDADKEDYTYKDFEPRINYYIDGKYNTVQYTPHVKELYIESITYIGGIGLKNATIGELIHLLTGLRETALAERVKVALYAV